MQIMLCSFLYLKTTFFNLLSHFYGSQMVTQSNLPNHSGSINWSTGCSLNIVFFRWNFGIFLSSVSSAAVLVFHLPGVCTYTGSEGKQRKARVKNIFKNFGKNTIFNEHSVVVQSYLQIKKVFFGLTSGTARKLISWFLCVRQSGWKVQLFSVFLQIFKSRHDMSDIVSRSKCSDRFQKLFNSTT